MNERVVARVPAGMVSDQVSRHEGTFCAVTRRFQGPGFRSTPKIEGLGDVDDVCRLAGAAAKSLRHYVTSMRWGARLKRYNLRCPRRAVSSRMKTLLSASARASEATNSSEV